MDGDGVDGVGGRRKDPEVSPSGVNFHGGSMDVNGGIQKCKWM
jgi:hypothetical protein